jgi:hypothetical protein
MFPYRGVVMSFICGVYIIENRLAISLFVDWLASAYSHSHVSMFWSLSTSIVIEF